MTPRDPDDADGLLVRGLLAREPAAWERLLDLHGGAIASACRRALARAGRGADEAAVADASAETVRALLEDGQRRLRAYRPGTPLAAYLRVIARSRTFDLLRREKGVLPLPAPQAASDAATEAAQAAERAAGLRTALAALPQRDAEALRLFHLEGMPYAGIARRLGLPAGQVGMLLSRARERLKEALGRDFLESV